MTDFDKLKALLTEFGVGFYANNSEGLIRCMQGDKLTSGYNRFYTEFQFDDNGGFIKMGAWE